MSDMVTKDEAVTASEETTQPSRPLSSRDRILAWRPSETVLRTIPLLLAIIALGIYTSANSPFFLTKQNMYNILQQISVLGLISIGMTLLMIAGLLDLSVGALASFITVIGARIAVDGRGALVIALASLGIGLVAGGLTGGIVAYARVAPFILTLGSMNVFISLGLIFSSGTPIPVYNNPVQVLGLGTWFGVPASGIVFVAVLIFGALAIRYTRLVRNAFALGANREAAFLAGISVTGTTIALFALNGLMVGAAGIVLLGRLGAGDANGGVGLELQAIAAVVLGGASLSGGRGSMWGSFLGVVLLGEIANSLAILGIQAFYQQLVYGAVLMVAVVATALREEGRFGLKGKLAAAVHAANRGRKD